MILSPRQPEIPRCNICGGLWSDRLCGSAKSISITAWSKAVYMSIGWKRKKASMRRIRLSAVLGSAGVITICLILCSRFPIPKSRLITIAIRPVMSRNLRARSLMWCSKWLRVQRIWRLWRRPFGKSAMNLPRRTIRKPASAVSRPRPSAARGPSPSPCR